MNTDRELLELAAKAAGMDSVVIGAWNPLTDDGDALRLAVKLRLGIKDFAPHDTLEIVQIPPNAELYGTVEIWREDDNDPLYVEWYKAGVDRYAATRRSIVRAAAEIGKAMP